MSIYQEAEERCRLARESVARELEVWMGLCASHRAVVSRDRATTPALDELVAESAAALERQAQSHRSALERLESANRAFRQLRAQIARLR